MAAAASGLESLPGLGRHLCGARQREHRAPEAAPGSPARERAAGPGGEEGAMLEAMAEPSPEGELSTDTEH